MPKCRNARVLSCSTTPYPKPLDPKAVVYSSRESLFSVLDFDINFR